MTDTSKKQLGTFIKENNSLRDQLTPENKRFYEDLLVLVRSKSLLLDDKVYEETLLVILQDLLSAQAAGKSAREYLGKDLDALATEIVQETPHNTRKNNVKMVAGLLGILLASMIGPNLVTSLITGQAFSISGAIISVIYSVIIGLLVLKAMSNSRFILKLLRQNKLKTALLSGLYFVLLVLSYMVIFMLTRNLWLIHF